MLTTQDEVIIEQQTRPNMSIDDQLKELRGAVRVMARISGPSVVADLMHIFPYLFMNDR